MFGSVPEPFTVWSAIKFVTAETTVTIRSDGRRSVLAGALADAQRYARTGSISDDITVADSVARSVETHIVAEVGVIASARRLDIDPRPTKGSADRTTSRGWRLGSPGHAGATGRLASTGCITGLRIGRLGRV